MTTYTETLCDVCEKDVNTSEIDIPKGVIYYQLEHWKRFDVCKDCYKNFKKWRKLQLSTKKAGGRNK